MAAHIAAGEFEQDCEACEIEQDTQGELRERWGCDGPRGVAVAAFQFRGVRIECEQCPRRMLPDDIAEATGFYPWLKEAGAWPAAGGILDQSATFVHAMSVYSGELGKLQEKQMEEARNGVP